MEQQTKEQRNKGTKEQRNKGTKKQTVHPIGSGITRSPGLVFKDFFIKKKKNLKGTHPQIISIFKGFHIGHKNSLNIDVLKKL